METKTLHVGDKQVFIPTSHTQIKLEQFERVIKIFSTEYDFPLQKNIDLAVTLTNLSEDEVEDLEFDDFKTIIQQINEIDVLSFGDVIEPTITIDGVEYGTKITEGEYKFTIKETLLLQNLFTKKEDGYLSEVCAIIYHPIVDGKIAFDYSEIAINKRKDIFKDLTINIVGPFLTKLTEFLIAKNA